MIQLLAIAVSFCLVIVVSYWYSGTANICPAPIKYQIGEIDERFSIDKKEVREILNKVELLWEDAVGRELFVYDESSDFTVNFIYDDRQQLVHTEEEWRISLDQEEKKSKELLSEVDEMNERYKKIEAEYERQRNAYEARLAKYNDKVEEYNKQGGAPKDEFAELKAEQEYLSKAMSDLIKVENSLNDLVKEINEQGEKANSVIEKYNQNVEKYNDIFGNLDVFTQGDFKRERINIYKFSNKTELSRVLAHEFGHSLGIEHVEDNESIMYYLMDEKTGSLELSSADKKALIEVCGDGSGFSHKIKYLINSIL